MDLSIIIVNWNSKDLLRQCLGSVFANTSGIAFEIIVIDSASFDGCEKMLADFFPSVRFVQLHKNAGFADANNQAVALAKGYHLLFLNPDTELISPAVNILFDRIRNLPYPGILGGRLLNRDRSIQTSSIKAFPTLLNQLIDFDFLKGMYPRSRIWGMRPLFENVSKPCEVSVISGACMMVCSKVFESVGGFSTDYFMYSEDVDLCYKAKTSGLRNYYVPEAIVVHYGGGSTAQTKSNTFVSVMMLESRWKYFVKTRSRSYASWYRIGIAVVSTVRITVAYLFWSFSRQPRWWSAFEKWHARLRWALGLKS